MSREELESLRLKWAIEGRLGLAEIADRWLALRASDFPSEEFLERSYRMVELNEAKVMRIALEGGFDA